MIVDVAEVVHDHEEPPARIAAAQAVERLGEIDNARAPTKDAQAAGMDFVEPARTAPRSTGTHRWRPLLRSWMRCPQYRHFGSTRPRTKPGSPMRRMTPDVTTKASRVAWIPHSVE